MSQPEPVSSITRDVVLAYSIYEELHGRTVTNADRESFMLVYSLLVEAMPLDQEGSIVRSTRKANTLA